MSEMSYTLAEKSVMPISDPHIVDCMARSLVIMVAEAHRNKAGDDGPMPKPLYGTLIHAFSHLIAWMLVEELISEDAIVELLTQWQNDLPKRAIKETQMLIRELKTWHIEGSKHGNE